MTTFVLWTGVDNRGITSLNFASDSRISWANVNDKIEYGQKLFYSQKYPEIFGFTGDVTLCKSILPHILTYIDTLDGISRCSSIMAKQELIYQEFEKFINNYPSTQKNNFSIFYGTKYNTNLHAEFGVLEIVYNKKLNKLDKKNHILENKNKIFKIYDGSGKEIAQKFDYLWEKSDVGGYSRAVFGAFCDAINSNEDRQTNNIAQIVSLWRGRENPIVTAYAHHKKIFLNGQEITDTSLLIEKNISIRNHLFEICDHQGNRLVDAQKQPRPFKSQ